LSAGCPAAAAAIRRRPVETLIPNRRRHRTVCQRSRSGLRAVPERPRVLHRFTGYVRTLADPTAPPPRRRGSRPSPNRQPVTGFADGAKQGRVAVPVSFAGDGFDGYAEVTQDGYLDYRFQTNRLVSDTDFDGYVWLVTLAEVDAWATELGVTVDPAAGILLGSVLDCQAFALENVVPGGRGPRPHYGWTDPDGLSDPAGVRPAVRRRLRHLHHQTGRFLLANVGRPGGQPSALMPAARSRCWPHDSGGRRHHRGRAAAAHGTTR
jgi:hypothetical protein